MRHAADRCAAAAAAARQVVARPLLQTDRSHCRTAAALATLASGAWSAQGGGGRLPRCSGRSWPRSCCWCASHSACKLRSRHRRCSPSAARCLRLFTACRRRLPPPPADRRLPRLLLLIPPCTQARPTACLEFVTDELLWMKQQWGEYRLPFPWAAVLKRRDPEATRQLQGPLAGIPAHSLNGPLLDASALAQRMEEDTRRFDLSKGGCRSGRLQACCSMVARARTLAGHKHRSASPTPPALPCAGARRCSRAAWSLRCCWRRT